eukprot:gene7926-10019_t
MKMLGWNLKAGLSYINARYLRLKGGQETIARQQIVTHNFHPLSPIQVMVVPILQDNFSYIIAHPRTSSAAIIDCGDAFPLLDIIRASQLNVTDILTTHHHADHCAGNEDLLKAFPTATIYGWDTRTAKLTHLIQPGDKLKLFRGGATVDALDVSGHTSKHVAFLISSKNTPPLMFPGDALFSAGCGRIFDGTPEMMFKSLKRLNNFDSNTLIFPGHEYTVNNLKFAQNYIRDHPEISCMQSDIDARLNTCLELQKQRKPTIPTTLAEERKYNLFLQAGSLHDFMKVRLAKDMS